MTGRVACFDSNGLCRFVSCGAPTSRTPWSTSPELPMRTALFLATLALFAATSLQGARHFWALFGPVILALRIAFLTRLSAQHY